ncbi:alpha-N-arabinofuranosidase [Parvularcula dongshanensis]|uniref:non-reducing end alpha-L-arabinofuranosidase n=1 Tax=Parvularcula dongshanensis TaxID=1173995 RepID=A0A840I493_9PROT|nr:alpha-L-arabinofuranosidase C-terminal domain-containing protein [Parvularcula dongshanensis]MBB4659806.1 alpha-N-arabinofuranosidase [Parvularcula dongshanensis]
MVSGKFKAFVLAGAALLGALGTAAAQDTVRVEIDPSSEGPKISRHIFGQFAEHLGTGVYGGVWVGPDSDIPNTRGIRNDVAEALRALQVPNVRWPGGCFADEYHWRDGIGEPADRKKRRNASWAGRIEDNAFGTHEFFDFLDQIGAEAFISANMGSGTVQEAADWLEYLTAEGTSLAEERARNGHPEPYAVAFWGLGNEMWGCGGPLSAQEYLSRMKRFSNFSTNYNEAEPVRQVAVGPDGGGFVDYTETVMSAWAERSWAWDIQGLSLHRYTRGEWPPKIAATGFGEDEYAAVIEETLGMTAFIETNAEIMDRYDPDGQVGIIVDEWGTWYEGDLGTLYQQNTQRDAVLAALNLNIFAKHAERVKGANIAQMVNVLQAMILTDEDRMVLTPTYHVFRMYVPFQDATRLDVRFRPGSYRVGDVRLPRVDAVAARDEDGKLWVALANVDAARPVTMELALGEGAIVSAAGETLRSSAIDAHNTFEQPTSVVPTPAEVTIVDGTARIELAPHAVAVVSVATD